MANTNAPFGFKPVRHMFGGTIRLSEYTIASGYNGASIYTGDPVVVTGTGRNIGIATGGSSGVVTGIFQGCEYVNALGDTIWSATWPSGTTAKSGTTIKAWVIDDPFVVFAIQSDATGVAEAGIRQLADFNIGTGSVAGGSGAYLTYAAGSETQLKILGLAGQPNVGGAENAYGAYATLEVLIATHELNTSSFTEV